MIALYHQIKTPIGFWYRWGLNSKYFILLSKTLLVELIRNHKKKKKKKKTKTKTA